MKQNWITTAVMLLYAIAANALIVSVNGEGEITEEGMTITLSEAHIDPLTGTMQMGVEGSLFTQNELTVTIERQADNCADEFCCANQCTIGNGDLVETLHFTPNGTTTWFVHYTPMQDSDVTIVYTFAEKDGETLQLTVRYVFNVQGLEQTSTIRPVRKILRNGIVQIETESATYYMQ